MMRPLAKRWSPGTREHSAPDGEMVPYRAGAHDYAVHPIPVAPAPRRRYTARMPARRTTPRRTTLTARTADRHALYLLAVQSPAADARLFARHFAKLTGTPLRRFREDFCGTAALSCAFVAQHRDNRAFGVDLDQPTLDWGHTHNVAALPAAARARVHLQHGDVRDIPTRAQIVCACNFSYAVFHTRPELLAYLRHAHRVLEPGGLLFLDAWGGGLVHRACVERHRGPGFDWLWHQVAFDPISHRIDCRIHFWFRDGSRLQDAFVYDWRLWMLPELREAFAEAGFEDVHVLWECSDPVTGLGNGRFRRRERAPDDPTWQVWVVGRKPVRGRGERGRGRVVSAPRGTGS